MCYSLSAVVTERRDGALPSSCITTYNPATMECFTTHSNIAEASNGETSFSKHGVNKRCGLFECGAAKELQNNYDIKSWLQFFVKQINSSRRCCSLDEGAVVRLLRIGKYKAMGETVKVTLQINSEQQSPSFFNHKQRTAQRKLSTNSKWFHEVLLPLPNWWWEE